MSTPSERTDTSWVDEPLPTASSGLITPNESSFLADSGSADSGVTGEAPLVTYSALPAAFAVSADADETAVETSPAYAAHLDVEHAVRTAAYYRYLERETAGQPGSEIDDWLSAENDVLRG